MKTYHWRHLCWALRVHRRFIISWREPYSGILSICILCGDVPFKYWSCLPSSMWNLLNFPETKMMNLRPRLFYLENWKNTTPADSFWEQKKRLSDESQNNSKSQSATKWTSSFKWATASIGVPSRKFQYFCCKSAETTIGFAAGESLYASTSSLYVRLAARVNVTWFDPFQCSERGGQG